jgi:transforming growth factor-beta-induced protein
MKKMNFFLTLSLVTGLFLISSCEKDSETMPEVSTPMTIAEIAAGNEDFSILVQALDRAGLVDVLNGDGNFTVFAPNNDAFSTFLMANDIESIDDIEVNALRSVLLYHVLGESRSSEMITEGYYSSMSPAQGRTVSMYIGTELGVSINGTAKVLTADIQATNGYIHVIDAVITPPSIVDIAAQNENFETLVSAVVGADLAGTLSDVNGTFTVFAPTDEAFAALGGNLPADLTPILLYHVLGSPVFSDQITSSTISSLNAASPQIVVEVTSSGVFLNGSAQVIAVDIVGTNGVIHVINEVLLPQ